MADEPRLRRLKMPRKQRSEMTPEEQLMNPEEGAHEQGLLETAEDALTQGRDQLPPGTMASTLPLFSDAVAEGKAEKGAEGFAQFIRGAGKKPVVQERRVIETVRTPRFGSSDQVRKLMDERKYLDLKTKAGRDRLKEIDQMLSNRTYFQE